MKIALWDQSDPNNFTIATMTEDQYAMLCWLYKYNYLHEDTLFLSLENVWHTEVPSQEEV